MDDEKEPKRSGPSVRTIVLVIVGVLLVWFGLVNRDDVNVTLLFGDGYDMPLVVALAIAALAGGVVGYLLARSHARSRR